MAFRSLDVTLPTGQPDPSLASLQTRTYDQPVGSSLFRVICCSCNATNAGTIRQCRNCGHTSENCRNCFSYELAVDSRVMCEKQHKESVQQLLQLQAFYLDGDARYTALVGEVKRHGHAAQILQSFWVRARSQDNGVLVPLSQSCLQEVKQYLISFGINPDDWWRQQSDPEASCRAILAVSAALRQQQWEEQQYLQHQQQQPQQQQGQYQELLQYKACLQQQQQDFQELLQYQEHREKQICQLQQQNQEILQHQQYFLQQLQQQQQQQQPKQTQKQAYWQQNTPAQPNNNSSSSNGFAKTGAAGTAWQQQQNGPSNFQGNPAWQAQNAQAQLQSPNQQPNITPNEDFRHPQMRSQFQQPRTAPNVAPNTGHIPPQPPGMQRGPGMNAQNQQVKICQYFLKGSCKYDANTCKFAHVVPTGMAGNSNQGRRRNRGRGGNHAESMVWTN